jgi:ferredoxin
MPFAVGIDRQRCQGHGKCMIDCPEVFDTDEQGYATLTQPDFADELVERVQQCVTGCPENALSIQPL